jgi:hypothetical protein
MHSFGQSVGQNLRTARERLGRLDRDGPQRRNGGGDGSPKNSRRHAALAGINKGGTRVIETTVARHISHRVLVLYLGRA